jgi:hypothetical protein
MKDAKGHGSESRGGGSNSPDVKANIQKAARLAKTLGADHPSVGTALHDAVMAARPSGGFYKIPDNGGQPVASNAHAAATLAGGPKSAPVDTHPAMASAPDAAGLAGRNWGSPRDAASYNSGGPRNAQGYRTTGTAYEGPRTAAERFHGSIKSQISRGQYKP